MIIFQKKLKIHLEFESVRQYDDCTKSKDLEALSGTIAGPDSSYLSGDPHLLEGRGKLR